MDLSIVFIMIKILKIHRRIDQVDKTQKDSFKIKKN
jgi:hypothetical protein